MEEISRSRRERPGSWSLERPLEDWIMVDVAAIASVICDAAPVMLVLAQAPPEGAGAVRHFACGFDRPPPDPAAVLALHRGSGGDVLLLSSLPPGLAQGPAGESWSGFGYCGVGLSDADGALIGVLCVLRRPPPGETLLCASRAAAFEALGRRLSAWRGELGSPAVAPPSGVAPAEGPRDTAVRILVVDDEAVVRMLVVDLLRERGYAVQEAEDAREAMVCLQGGDTFDLMVTDVGLPGGCDGSTLARRARVLRPGLPILFITGYAFGTNGDIRLEPDIPVLTKPFTLAALSARIGELLSGVRV